MKAEIVAVGDEILTGQTTDSNSAFIASELNTLGVDVTGIHVISDSAAAITEALDDTVGRLDLVIITGGLGPTRDDITKKSLADYFGATMVTNSEVLENIRNLLAKRGVGLTANNRDQAKVPDNCKVLMNRMGTAPGMWFRERGSIVISLPGVPYEMRHIVKEHVIPGLKPLLPSGGIFHRYVITYGLPEAQLAERLNPFCQTLPEELSIAYLPSYGTIRLRFTGRRGAEALADEKIRELYRIIPDIIVGEGDLTIEKRVAELLSERQMTLSVAESCTGGAISSLLVSIPGCSNYFKGSVVAYSNSLKTDILGVPESTIEIRGAVSEECVMVMAEGVKKVTGSDYSIATTGIAGPDGGTESKPAGTVWIAVSTPKNTITEEHSFAWDREVNITRSSIAALNLLRLELERDVE